MILESAVAESMCVAICLALIAFLWQASLIAGATALAAVVSRRFSAHAEYVVLCIGLAMLPAVFGVTCTALVSSPPPTERPEGFGAVTLPTHVDESPTAHEFAGTADAALPISAAISRPTPEVIADLLTDWPRKLLGSQLVTVSRPLVLSYGLIVAGLALRLLLGFWGSGRLCRTSVPVTDSELLARYRAVGHRLGLRSAPALAECSRLTVPAVVGILRPTILLPASLLSGLTPDELDAILIHELVHIRRCDPLINLLQRIVEALFFFHPAVWWLSDRIRRVREHSCDDRVLALGATREVYIESLLRVAEISLSLRPASTGRIAGVFATGEPSQLQERIERLLRETRRPTMLWTSRSLIFCLCGSLAAAGSPLALSAFAEPAPATKAEDANAQSTQHREPIDVSQVMTSPVEPSQFESLRLAEVSPERDIYFTTGSLAGGTQSTINLTQLDAGDVVTLRVTGRTDGSVWGTDVYTADSDIGTAAVHAGLVAPGQTALVRVTVLPSLPQYSGTPRNGVESRSYGTYPSSYAVSLKRVLSNAATNATPSFLSVTRVPVSGTGQVTIERMAACGIGESFDIELIGQTAGAVWGTNVYTADSDLPAAAVHAGVLSAGERASITVTIVPSPPVFGGSSNHGVTSRGWPSWPKAFVLSRKESKLPPQPQPVPESVPVRIRSSVPSSTQPVGSFVDVEIVGSNDGWVWGSDVYTGDSDVATAAVHAGVLEIGQRGVVTVIFVAPPNSFSGTRRNEVATRPYGAFPSAFVLTRKSTAPAEPVENDTSLKASSGHTREMGLISRLSSAMSSGSGPAVRPQSSTANSLQLVKVTGRIEGAVWGSRVYTSDSDPATAAVHSGLLQPGETGMILICMVPPPAAFQGSAQHGVISQDFGSFPSAYVLIKSPATSDGPDVPADDAAGTAEYGADTERVRAMLERAIRQSQPGPPGENEPLKPTPAGPASALEPARP